MIERLLNHVSGSFKGIVDVYQHYDYRDEKAEALLRWSQPIAGLTGSKGNNVVEMPKSKRRR